MPEEMLNAEDMLSTLDFKNHILKTREGITVPNSVYMKDKELPRNFMLSKFLSEVKAGVISLNDMDEESMENFKLFSTLIKGLK
jgi:hypothetical protein